MTVTGDPAPLTPGEAACALGAMVPILDAELSALPEAALRWRPAPDEWCILETLGHLIEAEERGFAGRIQQLLAEDDPLFATWDQPAVARERRDCERDPAALLGYNRVRPKPQATVVAEAGLDPLLAVWEFGRGRGVTFASDCGPHWAPPGFVEWEGYARLWQGIVGWVARGQW